MRELLLAAMGGISGARWQNDDQLHLTMRFIGEIDRHRAIDIHAALGAIHHDCFELAAHRFNSFQKRGKTGAVWTAVTSHTTLKRLHNKIDQALRRIGIPPDERTFIPHITLARLNRSSGPIDGFIDFSGGFSTPAFPIEWFGLFESTLAPDGALYSLLERYPLR